MPKSTAIIGLTTIAITPIALMLGMGGLTGLAGLPDDDPATAQFVAPIPEQIDFNRDIRAILTDRCFNCHGPDSAITELTGGLRFDSFEGATAEREGGIFPIFPGDLSKSELVRRVRHTDPEARMPPPESHLSLSEHEIQLLERWIEQGAAYDTHWAFKPTVSHPVPEDSSGWARNELDAFILDRLATSNITPSPATDRETLIRRVTLDLTGLPPTPDQIDAFLADTEPGSYERVVERLMANPHFGERVATMWLDAARYADTLGFHHDNKSSQWPWRDWVIEAFNTNKPFDTFLTEQLAGDLLEDPTLDQQVATAFNRNHSMTDEGGAIDAEYLVEYAADRVATLSTSVLGITMGCARCHDHKYDPFSQTDYYSMFAYFNSVEEKGLNSQPEGNQFGAFKPFLAAPSDSQKSELDTLSSVITTARELADAPIEGLDEELAAWETQFVASAGVSWTDLEIKSAESTGTSELNILDDTSVLASGEAPATDVYELTYHTDATGLTLLRLDSLTDESLPMGRAARASHGNAVLSEIELTATSTTDMSQSQTVRFDYAWTSHEQQNGDFGILRAIDTDPGTGWAPAGHQLEGGRVAIFHAAQPFGYEGGTDLTVRLRFESPYTQHALGRVKLAAGSSSESTLDHFPIIWREWFAAGPFKPGNAQLAYSKYQGPEGVQRVRTEDEFAGKKWVHKPDLKDGEVFPFSDTNAAYYFGRQIISPVSRSVEASLGSDDALKVWLNGQLLLAENTRRGAAADQSFVTLNLRPGENTLVCKVVNDGGPGGFYFRADEPEDAPRPLEPLALIPSPDREPSEAARLAEQFKAQRSPEYKARVKALATAESNLTEAEKSVPNVMVMFELEDPRETFVLGRGSYDQPIKSRPVTRRPPLSLGTLPDDAPANRLGLAQWVTADTNPLTARVAVNRFWHMIYGTGIVQTVEDFGTQGEWPSHPELLDWLATDFRDHNWDVKRLLTQIVTSSTYRQSSAARPELAEVDPSNRLLARFPRQRLTAEHIRDQALHTSGLLNDSIGGASVRPYQPEGLWIERSMPSSNTKNFMPSTGQDLYRRGMYTFWKRSAPPPQMTTFDAPEREFCVVRRGTTNTPLQALMLLNDVTYLEIARALAQRVILELPTEQPQQPYTADLQIARAFRLCTGRIPSSDELKELSYLHAQLLDVYQPDTQAALEVLSYGDHPRDESIPPETHAAMTMIASTILNLDETLTRD